MQQRLGQGRLAGPAVADQGDVADLRRSESVFNEPPRVAGCPGCPDAESGAQRTWPFAYARSAGRPAGTPASVAPTLGSARCSTDAGGPSVEQRLAARRRQPPPHRHHRRPPHRPSALLMAVGAVGRHRRTARSVLGLRPARPHRRARRARRRGRQGVGHGLAAWRVLRLGRRPRHRRPAARRRRLVPRDASTAATSAMLPLAVLAMSHAHLLRAGQGRVARLRRPRRAHGAGRADHRCSASGCCSTSLLVPVLWVMLVLTPSPRCSGS